MISGRLDRQFVEWAIKRGHARQEASRRQGCTIESHSGGVSGSFDGEGALAECIVAMAFGLPYPPIEGTFKRTPDVGPLEVQAVLQNSATRGDSLLIRPSDGEALHRPYVLVYLFSLGEAIDTTSYKLVGWMTGDEGCRVGTPNWWPGDRCYVIPRENLHPFNKTFWDFVRA